MSLVELCKILIHYVSIYFEYKIICGCHQAVHVSISYKLQLDIKSMQTENLLSFYHLLSKLKEFRFCVTLMCSWRPLVNMFK